MTTTTRYTAKPPIVSRKEWQWMRPLMAKEGGTPVVQVGACA